MKRPPPPLTFIRSFECAARHLSFTKAAEELGYTQAAISTHVRSLEKYVGRALFTRNARSLTLTEIGEAFLPSLRQALDQIDSATDAVLTGSTDLSVAVACPMSLAEIWLPQAIKRFRGTHPDVEVLVHGTVWDHAVDEIADIVISVLREDEVRDDYVRLWEERLVLLAPADQAEHIREPSDLVGQDRILVSGRQEYWSAMAEALGIAGLPGPTPLKTNGSNVSLELASQGLGVTVTPSTLARVFLRRGQLVEPFALRPPSPWAY
jgi:DNA-binding transcriptional LysR family regulator